MVAFCYFARWFFQSCAILVMYEHNQHRPIIILVFFAENFSELAGFTNFFLSVIPEAIFKF